MGKGNIHRGRRTHPRAKRTTSQILSACQPIRIVWVTVSKQPAKDALTYNVIVSILSKYTGGGAKDENEGENDASGADVCVTVCAGKIEAGF
jgi:hypothetical protein